MNFPHCPCPSAFSLGSFWTANTSPLPIGSGLSLVSVGPFPVTSPTNTQTAMGNVIQPTKLHPGRGYQISVRQRPQRRHRCDYRASVHGFQREVTWRLCQFNLSPAAGCTLRLNPAVEFLQFQGPIKGPVVAIFQWSLVSKTPLSSAASNAGECTRFQSHRARELLITRLLS